MGLLIFHSGDACRKLSRCTPWMSTHFGASILAPAAGFRPNSPNSPWYEKSSKKRASYLLTKIRCQQNLGETLSPRQMQLCPLEHFTMAPSGSQSSIRFRGRDWYTRVDIQKTQSWATDFHISTWNPFVLYFGGLTPQNKVFSIQNRGHLGSRYILTDGIVACFTFILFPSLSCMFTHVDW